MSLGPALGSPSYTVMTRQSSLGVGVGCQPKVRNQSNGIRHMWLLKVRADSLKWDSWDLAQ